MIDIEPFKLAVDDTEVVRATENVKKLSSSLDKVEEKIDNLDKTAGSSRGIDSFNDSIERTRDVTSKLGFEGATRSLDALKKQFLVMSQVLDSNRLGLNLSAKEVKGLTEDQMRLITVLQAQGATSAQIDTALKVLEDDYKKVSKSVNEASSQLERMNAQQRAMESLRSTYWKEYARDIDKAAKSTSEMSAYFASIEKASVSAEKQIERLSEEIKIMQKGFSSAEASRIFDLRAQGVDASVINKLTDAQREWNRQSMSTVIAAKNTNGELDKTNKNLREINNLARGVGVQMGDVAISLASGMNPLIVFLQQGDQIRGLIQQSGIEAKNLGNVMSTSVRQIGASFVDVGRLVGGFVKESILSIGSAITNTSDKMLGLSKTAESFRQALSAAGASEKALASFDKSMSFLLASMRTLAGIGGGIVLTSLLGLSVAFFQVQKENNELARSLNLSGASMGLMVGEANALANSLTSTGVSAGKTLQVISAMSKEGGFTKEAIAGITEVAVKLEKFGGVAIEETVKKFAQLKKDPVDALIKIASETGNVNSATLQSVIALQQQGDAFGAVALATDAASKALSFAADDIESELTGLSKFFISLGEGIANFYDKVFKSLFRTDLSRTALETAKANTEAMLLTVEEGGSAYNKLLEDIVKIDERLKRLDMKEANASFARLASTATASFAKVETAEEKYFRNQRESANQLQKLAELRSKGVDVAETERMVLETINRTQSEYIKGLESTKQAKKDAEKVSSDFASVMQKITGVTNDAEGAQQKYTKAQELFLDIAKSPAWATFNNEQKKAIGIAIESAVAIEKQNEATKALIQQQNRQSEANSKVAKLIGQVTQQYDLYGGKLEQLDSIMFEAGFSIEEQADAINRLTREILNFNNTRIERQQFETLATLSGQTRELELQLSLVGATETERRKQLSLLKVQLELEKEIRDINRVQGLSPEQRAERIAQANEIAAVKIKNINREVALDFVNQFRVIQNQLSDILYTAIFEGGSAGGRKLKEFLKAEFKKIVIKVVLDPITSGFSQVLGSLFNSLMGGSGGSILSSAAGAGGSSGLASGLQLANIGTSLSKIATTLGASFSEFSAGLQGLQALGGTGTAAFKAGQFAATPAGALAGAAAGVYGGRAISGGFSAGGGSGNSNVNLGTAAGAAIGTFVLPGVGTSLGAAIGGAIGGAINRVFGRSLKDTGIQGSFGGSQGFSGQSFEFFEGGLFRSDKTKTAELDSGIQQMLSEQFKLFQTTSAVLATSLGLSAESVSKFTKEIKLSFKGLTDEQIQQKLQEEFSAIQEELANLALGSREFLKAGETALQGLQRLSDALLNMNAAFQLVGFTLFETSAKGADAASNFAELFGGISQANQALGFFFENFFKEEDKIKKQTEALTAEFTKLGKELPASRDLFKEMVTLAQAQGDNTLVANLLKLAPAFAELNPILEETSNAVSNTADVLSARFDLENRLLELQGRGTEVLVRNRNKELDAMTKLDPAFGSLLRKIYELEDASTKVSSTDVLSSLMQVGSDVLSPAQFKQFKINRLLDDTFKIFSDRGIKISESMIRGATSASVFNNALALYESGNFDLAKVLLDSVPILKEVADAWQETEQAVQESTRRQELELRLLQTLGMEQEVLAINRQKEIEEILKTDASLVGLVMSIQAAEDAVSRYNAAVEKTRIAQDAVNAAQDRVDDIRNRATQNYLDAQQRVIDLQNESKKAYKESAKSLREYLKSLVPGSSAASAGSKLAFARADLQVTAQQALGGDKTALERIQEIASTLLASSAENARTGQELRSDEILVRQTLNRVADFASSQGIGLVEAEDPLVVAQREVLSALSVANQIGASLEASQSTLVDEFKLANVRLEETKSALATAKAEEEATKKILDDIKANTGRTADLIETTKAAFLVDIDARIKAILSDDEIPQYAKDLFTGVLDEIKSTIKLIADETSLPADVKLLALKVTGETFKKTIDLALGKDISLEDRKIVFNQIDKLNKSVELAVTKDISDDNRKIVLNTVEKLSKSIDLSLGADISADDRKIVFNAIEKLNKTVDLSVGADLSENDRKIVLNTVEKLSKVVEFSIGSKDISANDRKIILNDQIPVLDKIVGFAIKSDTPTALRTAILEGTGTYEAIIKATASTGLTEAQKKVLFDGAGSYVATMQAIVDSSLDATVKDLLLKGAATGSKSVTVSATLGAAITADQRKLLDEAGGEIRRTVNAAITGGTITADQRRILDQATESVDKTVKAIVADSGLTAEQKKFLNLVTGTPANSTVTLSGTVTFDPSTPLKSIFDAIKESIDVLKKGFAFFAATISGKEVDPVTLNITNRTLQQASPEAGFRSTDKGTFLAINDIALHIKEMRDAALGTGTGLRIKFDRGSGTTIQQGGPVYAKGGAFSGGVQAFASGGAFTNSLVNNPTYFNIGLMGEAGPEAIVPLTRMPNGDLGVQMRMPGASSDSSKDEEIAALRQEVRNLSEIVRTGLGNVSKNTYATQQLLNRWDGGDRMQVEIVQDTGETVNVKVQP